MHVLKPAVCLVVATALGLVVVGCTVDRPDEVPADALMVTEGEKTLAYRAPENGRVYVYDVDGQRIIYSGDIARGDTIRLDSDKDRISIDDRTVFEKGLKWNHRHRIFFDPHGDVQRRVTVEERTVIERDVRDR